LPNLQETIGGNTMSTILQDIDDVIIHQLKLHWPTAEDLTLHVAEKIIPKYPDGTITVNGITSRLQILQDQCMVQPTYFGKRIAWRLCETISIPNRIWNIIVLIVRLECDIKSIIHTIQKQDHTITNTQINNAIGILQSEKIIQVNNKIASLTTSERQSILVEVQS